MAKNTALVFLCFFAIKLLLVSGTWYASLTFLDQNNGNQRVVEFDGDESKRDDVPDGPDPPPHHNHVQLPLPEGNAGDVGNGEVGGRGTNSGKVDDVRPPDHTVVNIDEAVKEQKDQEEEEEEEEKEPMVKYRSGANAMPYFIENAGDVGNGEAGGYAPAMLSWSSSQLS